MTSADRRPHALRVALVGAGRVGTAVTLLLKKRGHEVVGVSSRTAASRAEAADRLDSVSFDHSQSLPPADVVLIGAGDAAIPEVAAALAPHASADMTVCHFAGSLGIAPLGPLTEVGARPVAIHPVQACPDVDTAVARLPGSAWGVTCQEDAREWATSLIERELDGVPFWIEERDRSLWHSASVTVSNGIAALLAMGESILRAIGIVEPINVLGPLAAGTIANARAGGGGGPTLTGPVVRSEVAVVERHLIELDRKDPALAAGYAAVAAMIVRAARDSERIDETTAHEMLTKLERS